MLKKWPRLRVKQLGAVEIRVLDIPMQFPAKCCLACDQRCLLTRRLTSPRRKTVFEDCGLATHVVTDFYFNQFMLYSLTDTYFRGQSDWILANHCEFSAHGFRDTSDR